MFSSGNFYRENKIAKFNEGVFPHNLTVCLTLFDIVGHMDSNVSKRILFILTIPDFKNSAIINPVRN